MCWAEIGDFTKAVAPVFTAGAACFGAWIAKQGLEKWRSETHGKRRAEIAEATLAVAYEMEEILQTAREPLVLAHEMTKKQGIPDHIATDANYAPEARLHRHDEFFVRFRSQRYAFAAVFGREAAKPLYELWRCRLEISWAVEALLENKGAATVTQEQRNLMKTRRQIAFRSAGADDAMSKRIEENISAFEKICGPAIKAKANAE